MSYHLHLALRIEREDSQIFYNSEAFADKAPIVISVPEIVEILSHFISEFEKVAVVDKDTGKSTERKDAISETAPKFNSSQNNPKKAVSLRSVSTIAYIKQLKIIDKSSIENLCTALKDYLSKALSELSQSDLLNDELTFLLAGIQEVCELRNFLVRYVKTYKQSKMYNDGYILIIKV
ncbi:hypothetical protein [Nostoc sp. 'Peltigera malacea cyanobiont' DB3992]|uniref:hypothetical protein n=1 Tax=Nostoc sp. 'Peltigera malacea cyanobiont' DB3992 TaxID=1206980 RepID=UPI000C04F902|nr:hypothetical protein [Nostoc sp. 'Peltigera malacea cyanobiont' DB3992]PHM07626.1 hypothetical protein CK516_25920 [Nostoc sp. 'Peltigera malacea cyanobiont' DB3992]